MKINPWKLSALVLTGALALSVAVGPATSAPQPMMKKALASLKAAKKQLAAATADKGVFRVKAIADVDSAISNVEQGIAFDNTH